MSICINFQSDKLVKKGINQNIMNVGINAALHNSGVMRHGLNANYYANHNSQILAIREGVSATWDAISGSRK